ncbi:HAD family hydrolase [Paracoccus nototheniae]|uniref:sucrose-phosphate synthase n=1 Tax=Paracoccus nototheniae TaxID=2489002 RepID=A0ABW4DXE9_9RHOB|nr:HAD family hydrolase [Paracoccus nototheniae]
MYILHVALGGCLRAPPVSYGITEDTGGHIAYLLGAAMAQARLAPVAAVDIVTRAFQGPGLDAAHDRMTEPVAPGCRILRLRTANNGYLSKEALEAEIPALGAAFIDLLRGMARRPDVIHAHFADAARLARMAQQEFGIPWIYTPHSLALQKNPDAARLPALQRRIADERTAIADAGAIILSSRDEAERQLRPYGADAEGRSHCIAPGVVLARQPDPAIAEALLAPFLRDPALPILLAVARPVHKKNLAGLVDAYAASPALQARANLVILAGLRDGIERGPTEQDQVLRGLFDRIDRHGLWGKVALPPRHDAVQLRGLYARAAMGGVFVNPAFHEPFGLTLVEAAQAGVPVVATRHGGPVDILDQLGHGALVDPLDGAQIADACLRLMIDPDRAGGVAAAQRRALALFDWQAWAQRSLAVIDGLRQPPLRPRRVVRRILASDIDGTLTGSRSAARQFGDWHAARPETLMFAVATGRSLSEARRVLQAWQLPRPDLFITSVGSEIWRWSPGGGLTLCADYARHLDAGWDRAGVLGALSRHDPRWQAGYEQRRWKLSLLGDAAQAAVLRDDLAASGLGARVIASHGQFIDILPPLAGKAAALRFEAARRGLDPAQCITAGDSGNDADMLMDSGAAILPANAYAELDHLRGRGLYRSPFAHAAGVIDGLTRLGLAGRPAPQQPRPAAGRTNRPAHA